MIRHWIAGLALAGAALVAAPSRADEKEKPAARPPRVYLGVTVQPTPREAERSGVAVQAVAPDSPAAKAGITPNDVIEKVGNREVHDFDGLVAALASHKPGDKLTFHVRRDGQEKSLSVTLAERPARRAAGERERPLRERPPPFSAFRPCA